MPRSAATPTRHRSLLQSAPAVRRELLAWYRQAARVLPWRERPSLYATVVSEFMLQQTQVKTALPYFERWLARWPDFASLAAAEESAVLKAWEGLGYYSRARRLHALARALAARPGSLPRSAEEWAGFDGVGPYTAAAIASMGCGEPAACVDGNVMRILARLTADGRLFRSGSVAARAFSPLAGALLDPRQPGDHNQAMMELGATVCLPRAPLCRSCPVRRHCRAHLTGAESEYPRLLRPSAVTVRLDRVLCLRSGGVLMHRIPASGRSLSGLWEIPPAASLPLSRGWKERAQSAGTKSRSIGRRRIQESFWIPAEADGALALGQPLGDGLAWMSPQEVDAASLSGPHRRWLEGLLATAAPLPGDQVRRLLRHIPRKTGRRE